MRPEEGPRVKALSRLFRTAFQHLLQKTPLFPQVASDIWQKDWVVHCKPVGNGQTALRYLAPYIYRVALSNRRLIRILDTGNMEFSQVTFQYRTSDTGQLKLSPRKNSCTVFSSMSSPEAL